MIGKTQFVHHYNYVSLFLLILWFSFNCVGTPLLALTGTADVDTEKAIVTDLIMKNPVERLVTPNGVNLRLSVYEVSRKDMLMHLDWVVDMIKEHGKETPKAIIFYVSVGESRRKCSSPKNIQEP